MTTPRWWLALPAILLATAGPAPAAEVRDKAGMFSAEAVKKAQSEIERIERESSVPITIETVESLNGKNIDDVIPEHARSVDAKGLYVLMARREHKIDAMSSKGYAKYLTRARDVAIRDAFSADFRKGDFDAGLARGIEKIGSTFAEAKAEAGGTLRPATTPAGRRAAQAPVAVRRAPVGGIPGKESWGMGSLMMIVLGIFGVFIVLRILGSLFSAGRGGYGGKGMGGPGGYGPGGGPGYGYGGGGPGGGGGGGFMSSMFGGIGGAMAGNWLYDQFSGGRHHGSTDQAAYDPATGAAAPEEAGPDWVGPNDGGGDWGAGGGADPGGGGGDWGGGGGGGGDDAGGGW